MRFTKNPKQNVGKCTTNVGVTYEKLTKASNTQALAI